MAATATRPERDAPKGASSSGLDTMLTDATRGPLRRLLPGRAAAKLAGRLALRPDTVVTRGAQLAAEMAKIGMGRSDIEPPKRDRRFKDPAWKGNPAYKRLGQAYMATARALDALVADAGLTVKSITSTTRPDIASGSMHSKALNLDVDGGQVIGFTDIDEIHTEEGRLDEVFRAITLPDTVKAAA